MGKLDEILQEIEEMKYPIEGIGCGLEDVGITDRYEAAEYGWNEAVEMVSDIVKNHLSDLENYGWIPVEERLPEKDGVYDFTVVNGIGERVLVTWQFLSGGHLSGRQTYIDGIHYLADNYKGDPINELLSKNVIAWRYRPEPYRKDGEWYEAHNCIIKT